jgi:hypothetical protein
MSDAPVFFVPGFPVENHEACYIEIAQHFNGYVPIYSERIYSITYQSRNEEWVATVGESLCGTKLEVVRIKGKKTNRVVRLTDSAIVLAIFPGYPYKVVTNAGLAVRSEWENPFIVGQPSSIIKFKLTE